MTPTLLKNIVDELGVIHRGDRHHRLREGTFYPFIPCGPMARLLSLHRPSDPSLSRGERGAIFAAERVLEEASISMRKTAEETEIRKFPVEFLDQVIPETSRANIGTSRRMPPELSSQLSFF